MNYTGSLHLVFHVATRRKECSPNATRASEHQNSIYPLHVAFASMESGSRALGGAVIVEERRWWTTQVMEPRRDANKGRLQTIDLRHCTSSYCSHIVFIARWYTQSGAV